MKYLLLCDESVFNLSLRIEALWQEGYRLYGNPYCAAIFNAHTGHVYHYQAMINEENNASSSIEQGASDQAVVYEG